jgi:cyclopropane-fatty-acyl-phospholipid synthase
MNTTTSPLTLTPPRTAPAAARAVFHGLRGLRHGTLDLQLPDGSQAHFGSGGAPRASLRLHNWQLCSAALRRGDIGVAETYIAGDWSTPDLRQLMSLFIANRDALESMVYGRWWGSLLYRIKHLLNRNSKRGSRNNVHAHYDLGNAFYRVWLDETMNYSSGWFEGDPNRSLPDAQAAKVRRALTECGVEPGHRVLEIGCGWGALAQCATEQFGAHVTGVTLSTEQLAWARERVPTADLRLQDYRDIADGPFDAVCSIEMVEAVGREYWPGYFGALNKLLRPGGRACVQSIVIDDALWERYIRGTDFIQQYIFPGRCLPCPREFKRAAEAAGLVVVDAFHFGRD